METKSEVAVSHMHAGSDEVLNQLTHEVIGAAIEVHRHLGPGYLECVYEEALAYELSLRGLPFTRQSPFRIEYKGRCVGEGRTDLVVKQQVLIELKAVESMHSLFTAQTLSYLKATGIRLGLLMNFNVPVLKDGINRIIF